MRQQSIHIPDSLRLLSLVNGKRCEHCCRVTVNANTQRNYGLFICSACKTNLTKVWKKMGVRYSREPHYSSVFSHERVLKITPYLSDQRHDFLRQPFLLPSRGIGQTERGAAGPIVTFDDVDKMAKHEAGVDDYLQTIRNAAAPEEYNVFLAAYDDCIQRAKDVEKERSEKKKQRKFDKIFKMIEDLKALLEEPWRETAMFYSLCSSIENRRGLLEFHASFVSAILQEFIMSPNKMLKKDLKECATTINGKIQLIVGSNFLEYSFLSAEDPFEAKLCVCLCQIEYGHHGGPRYEAKDV